MSSEWFLAAERGDTEVLLVRLERGADINERGDHAGYRGMTALVDLARRLRDADPSIDVSGDARFCCDTTYLMLTAELGSLDMVNFLIDRGADIEGEDDLGDTVLMRAARRGHAMIVSRLLDQGANVNINWPCYTALSQAEANGHHDVAALVLARGAKYRLVDAVDRDDLKLAKELLLGGADPESEHVFIGGNPDFHDNEDVRFRTLQYKPAPAIAPKMGAMM
jgi:ankyrin repeat protein